MNDAERLKRITVDYERPYDLWIETLPIPVHRGFCVEDVRTLPEEAYADRTFEWSYGSD